jgi:hypothetical protein
MKQTRWPRVFVDGDAYTRFWIFSSSQDKQYRCRYENWVEDVVSQFEKNQTSWTLMKAIADNRKGNKVIIVPSRGPYYPAPKEPRQYDAPPSPQDMKCDARAAPDDEPAAKPSGPDECSRDWEHPNDKSHDGTGEGTQVKIYYSPWVWPDQRVEAICSQDDNAGNNSDEVLLHELVHAWECLNGTIDKCTQYPTRTDPTYETDNVAEFFAILVANLYSSETHRKLRKDHKSFKVMPVAVATSKAFHDRHSSAIDQLRRRYPIFINSLASLKNVPFNPFAAD